MKGTENSLFLILTSIYSELEGVDKVIADYFLHNDDEDLSANHIAKKIHVSMSSLSRFSQKLGYDGYREFKYAYQDFKKTSVPTDKLFLNVFKTYQKILIQNYNKLQLTQLKRIAKYFVEFDNVFVYGIGSSGVVAKEIEIRFMRLGINIHAISDVHTLKMNKSLIDNDTLVLGISLSGNENVVQAMKDANKRNGKTVLFTANDSKELTSFIDDIVLIEIVQDLDIGNVISPQFPVLLAIDSIYTLIMNSDKSKYQLIMRQTLSEKRMLK